MNRNNYPVARGGQPVTPLPNPGEGPALPTYPEASPVPPDQGSTAYPEAGPVVPIPDPGEGGPVYPSPGAGVPVAPLPNPGEGGPVYGGSGSIIVYPLPAPPCFYCGTGGFCKTRFLNATDGYLPFRILINGRLVTSALDFSALTPYGKVGDGFHTITITAPNGYVHLRKTMPFRAGDAVTLAIINSATGIDILEISDAPCSRPSNTSCFRVCNLGYYTNPLDILLYDGQVIYSDVRFKEVTSFKTIRPGQYYFYVANTIFPVGGTSADIETVSTNPNASMETGSPLVSFTLNTGPDMLNTAYILNWQHSADAIQIFTVQDALS